MTVRRMMRAGDWLMAACLALGLAWMTGAYGISARFWYEPVRVIVADAVEGQPFVMDVDRRIKRSFRGSYTVVVRTLAGNVVICEAGGAVNYRPDSALPVPVTMAWWAWSDPRCHGANMAPGQYVMTTTWVIEQPFGILPDKSVSIVSPPFTVRPAYDVQQQTIDDLKREVETLRGSPAAD